MRPLRVALLLPGACAAAPKAPPSGGGDAITRDSGAPDSGLAGPVAPVRFAFPLADPLVFDSVLGVDHDPADHSDEGALGRTICQDYLARSFPYCYDGHEGTDFVLRGGFAAMDAGSVAVLAGLAGRVIEAEDGHYDRCHADAETGDVSCDGHEMIANRVILEHVGDDGSVWRSRYWHLQQGSVAVAAGDAVAAGEVLGRVGSSGYSSFPHLHFELEAVGADGAGVVVDPYAGPMSQALSYWCDQGPPEGVPGGCAGAR